MPKVPVSEVLSHGRLGTFCAASVLQTDANGLLAHNRMGDFAGSDEEGYTITEEFVKAMIETFREQQNIHSRFAFQIVLEVRFLAEGACLSAAHIKK